MKILFAGLVVMAAVSGCNQSTPGGPGTAEKKLEFVSLPLTALAVRSPGDELCPLS